MKLCGQLLQWTVTEQPDASLNNGPDPGRFSVKVTSNWRSKPWWFLAHARLCSTSPQPPVTGVLWVVFPAVKLEARLAVGTLVFGVWSWLSRGYSCPGPRGPGAPIQTSLQQLFQAPAPTFSVNGKTTPPRDLKHESQAFHFQPRWEEQRPAYPP